MCSIALKIDGSRSHSLSPYLSMQFMEPLGTSDSSVDAAWDFLHDCWDAEFVSLIEELRPPMLRWGGCFASYYHWYEAVGPQSERVPMLNYWWNGMYMNQVGTDELAWLARKIGTELLLVVNMESEGRHEWAYPKPGVNRFGTAEEARDWVDYCNNPDNPLRLKHGFKEPFNVKWWQIGNETGGRYAKGYNAEQTAEVTERFVKAMRQADPTIKIIAWGDDGFGPAMMERLGNSVDLYAFHGSYGVPKGGHDALKGQNWRRDPDETWQDLALTLKPIEDRIASIRSVYEPHGKRLAMTEGHYCLPGRNRNDVLSSWAVGVAYARILNIIARHSDILDIATTADFCGTRWFVNAMMLQSRPREGKHYLMPVGHVMKLFSHHQGDEALAVDCDLSRVDATASRRGNRLYLHLANPSRVDSAVLDLSYLSGQLEDLVAYEIALPSTFEVDGYNVDALEPSKVILPSPRYVLPASGVAVVEGTIA